MSTYVTCESDTLLRNFKDVPSSEHTQRQKKYADLAMTTSEKKWMSIVPGAAWCCRAFFSLTYLFNGLRKLENKLSAA